MTSSVFNRFTSKKFKPYFFIIYWVTVPIWGLKIQSFCCWISFWMENVKSCHFTEVNFDQTILSTVCTIQRYIIEPINTVIISWSNIVSTKQVSQVVFLNTAIFVINFSSSCFKNVFFCFFFKRKRGNVFHFVFCRRQWLLAISIIRCFFRPYFLLSEKKLKSFNEVWHI